MNAVEVSNLRIELAGSIADIVSDFSLSIGSGEIFGLVGESGSGKTTVGLALLGYARPGARIAGGQISVAQTDILSLSASDLRGVRGRLVAYVPQDPASALNPALRIRRQLGEILEVHDRKGTSRSREERIREILEEVDLPTDAAFLARYPHQLSGGQLQRVAIAMAVALEPRVIVLDEPTTGLDVITQARVLDTVRQLCRNRGVGALYITHDLAVVASLVDRVFVMYAGRLAELGRPSDLFERPKHPYTARLVAAIPDAATDRPLQGIPGHAPSPGERPQGCFFAPRCPLQIETCHEVEPPTVTISSDHFSRCHRTEFVVRPNLQESHEGVNARNDGLPVVAIRNVDTFYGANQALSDVSLDLKPHECLALVGESGSGKTTLSRAIVGLTRQTTGNIFYRGQPLAWRARDRPAEARRSLQYIFQNPYGSLNPRRTVSEIIATSITHFFGVRRRDVADRVGAALERVSLPHAVALKYPGELSGGERQRVAIARALACEPDVLICDEVTSALDVSVQATIVDLLDRLCQEEGLAILFVTHNIALVPSIADRVIVMLQGRIVEEGPTDSVLNAPRHAYTRELIANTPATPTRTDVRADLSGEQATSPS